MRWGADMAKGYKDMLAEADALLVRPAHDPARKAGEQVSFLAL